MIMVQMSSQCIKMLSLMDGKLCILTFNYLVECVSAMFYHWSVTVWLKLFINRCDM